MSSTRVIIAGGGIAGPVLAMFLKLKGYDPVVYERAEGVSSSGLSLALQPNGMRVLGLIPGLVDKIVGASVVGGGFFSLLPEDYGELMKFDGAALHGVRRPIFHQTLVDHAIELGVSIVFSHELVSLEQDDDGVRATFANGKTDSASFLVGCDGLHSNTRVALFGEEAADFTGLTQTGGISPIPAAYPRGAQGTPVMSNCFGDGFHLISYPINETDIAWAITQKEPEAPETWRAMDEDRQKAFRESPYSQLGFSAGDLVKSAQSLVKYGLYDRPELKSWHKGRVVLIGDAAHPTSPHLGQGANQAFEDIYHLVRLLLKHNPECGAPTADALERAFAELEEIRIPRTSALVKGARQMGEMRVVHGVEACKRRNEGVRGMFKQIGLVQRAYADLAMHPFEEGRSEI